MSVGYHRVAAVWELVVIELENGASVPVPVQVIDRSQPTFVRATMEGVEEGYLCLVVQGEGEPVTTLLGMASSDESLYELDFEDFPVGRVQATLEYWVDGERIWADQPREITVGRVDGSVTSAQTNSEAGTLDITMAVDADGPLQGAHIYVDATAKALEWDDILRGMVETEGSMHRFNITARDSDGRVLLRIPVEQGPTLWRVELTMATDRGLSVQFPTTYMTFGTWSEDVIVSQTPPNPIEAASLETVRDWEEAVAGIESRYADYDMSRGTIVFAGSSSIRIWHTLETDFPGLPVVNAGFGGSRIAETTVYADRLIVPFNPHTIVFYAGSNDISGGWTPERVLADYMELVHNVHAELPDTRMIFISIAPSPGRWVQHPRVEQANRLIEVYSQTDDRLDYIDVYSLMLGKDGLPIPERGCPNSRGN